jgi:N-formylglutamate amidohydrolase
MIVKRSVYAGIMLTVFTHGFHAAAADYLVLAKPGGLPILITAPHGGSEVISGVMARTSGKTLKDEHTLELAEALANRLHKQLGARPYLVAARFSRKYIDANRKETTAYNGKEAKLYYDEYHRRIREFIAEIRQKHPGGALLIDIHGQSTDNGALYRGTRNGTTVDNLLNLHGCAALTGKNSVFGVLTFRGYPVIPANSDSDCLFEEAKYVGGYTVATYGSNNADGIDAIQLEIGGTLRKKPAFADDLAEAVATFYKKFLVERR